MGLQNKKERTLDRETSAKYHAALLEVCSQNERDNGLLSQGEPRKPESILDIVRAIDRKLPGKKVKENASNSRKITHWKNKGYPYRVLDQIHDVLGFDLLEQVKYPDGNPYKLAEACGLKPIPARESAPICGSFQLIVGGFVRDRPLWCIPINIEIDERTKSPFFEHSIEAVNPDENFRPRGVVTLNNSDRSIYLQGFLEGFQSSIMMHRKKFITEKDAKDFYHVAMGYGVFSRKCFGNHLEKREKVIAYSAMLIRNEEPQFLSPTKKFARPSLNAFAAKSGGLEDSAKPKVASIEELFPLQSSISPKDPRHSYYLDYFFARVDEQQSSQDAIDLTAEQEEAFSSYLEKIRAEDEYRIGSEY